MKQYPLELLTLAHFTLVELEKACPQAARRRCVSTAYYAVFHHFIGRAVGRLNIGKTHLQRAMRHKAARWPQHTKMKALCVKFASGGALSTLPEHERAGWPSPSSDLVSAAQDFIWLQGKRHEADYDLSRPFKREDAEEAIERARRALSSLDTAQASDPWAPWFLLQIMIPE